MTPDPIKIFLEFQYGAITDLVKTYLTLEIALLTFSVTFAGKMFAFAKDSFYRKIVVASIWTALIVAIIYALNSLNALVLAATKARLGLDMSESLKVAATSYGLSGELLVGSLLVIVVTALIGLFTKHGPDNQE